jgi:neutral ceramidase
MMGYASLGQTDTGLHSRQRSRAYIIADQANPTERLVVVNADIAMGDSGIRRAIIAALKAKYGDLYNDRNVAIIGTHQHSGVGGFLENLLPQLTSLGFVRETFDAIVKGTVAAIDKAHGSLAPGTLSIGNTTIVDGNLNRSPYAYLQNPAEERARYKYDTDKDMSLVKFTGSDGVARGFMSFFAVHGTSLYMNNTLVSTDNKGMAATLYEDYVEPNSMPGAAKFVAGFIQSNVGDTTPNTLGAVCFSPGKPYDGQPCDFAKSTCGNTTQECMGRGPGFRTSDFESNYLIGLAQFSGAKKIMDELPKTDIKGKVSSVHTWVDMSKYAFKLANGTSVHTCPPAMGYGFAGGTTDGPGLLDFTQGSTSGNPFWDIVKGAVTPFPSEEQIACQSPKPILLNTGYATFPYTWSPAIVDIQLFRVGQLVMLIVPGEFTTMAGRRIREAVRAKLIAEGTIGQDAYVVLAGPANTYGHYITTREEYGVQRYEGGSTLYGPYTLEAYLDIYTGLSKYLGDNAGTAPALGQAPPDLTGSPLSLRTGVVMDSTPIGKKFGEIITDVKTNAPYARGQNVTCSFNGANPRNNLRLEGTFLSVDRLVDGKWVPYRSDSHPSTIYRWTRTNTVLGYSTVDLSWKIEDKTPPGVYRFVYFGDSKAFFGGGITAFTGTSSNFTVA